MCPKTQHDHPNADPPERTPPKHHDPSTEALQKATPNPGIFAKISLGLVRCYQVYISPLTPPVCRYTPSCSEYTRQAIVKYGAFRGCLMGTRRILRCHPFHPGGHDPVP